MKDFTHLVGHLPEVMEEYTPDMMNDTPRAFAVKTVLSRLPEDERRIMVVYSETRTVRNAGAVLGMNYRTLARRVAAIRQKIVEELKISA